MKLSLAILLFYVVAILAKPESQNLIGSKTPEKSEELEKPKKLNIVTVDLENNDGMKIKADVDVSKVRNKTGRDDLDLAQIIGQFLQEHASSIIKQAIAQSIQDEDENVKVKFT